MTRSWRMFAGRPKQVVDGREFLHFGDERAVRFRGTDPIPVELIEDPQGQYWGWIHADRETPTSRRYTGTPVMVQPHEGMFRMQSPDGFVDKVARGDGEIVRMSCWAVEEKP